MEDIKTKPKFKIGDIVCSKHIGYPFIGTIWGILDAKTYMLDKGASYAVHKIWDDFCPNWLDEYIYYIKYSLPQRPMTFEEYIDSYEICWHMKLDKTNKEDSELWYSKYIKEMQIRYIVCHPEADLELFE